MFVFARFSVLIGHCHTVASTIGGTNTLLRRSHPHNRQLGAQRHGVWIFASSPSASGKTAVGRRAVPLPFAYWCRPCG
jgi:hypothetical protein